MNKAKQAKLLALAFAGATCLSACNPFIFGEEQAVSPIETFENCKNSLTFALYNYYGYEGQHFTNKWLGMLDALNDHGVEVEGYFEEKDARNFKISYRDDCDLPADRDIYMTNNQNWDTSAQFTKPLAKHHPMAIISTCNGVEMAASSVLSSGMGVSNATMGGFGDYYRKAFVNGSLRYLVAKYTAHILPIFAACVDAVDKGVALRNEDGTALNLNIGSWAIQTLDQYDEMNAVDTVSRDHPTLRKINVDKFFDPSSPDYGAVKLAEWSGASTKENIKALWAENGENAAEDEAAFRKGKKLTCGIIAPSSINDQVAKYITYFKEYCGAAYNVQFIDGSVTSTVSQAQVAKTLVNQKCDFMISLQDDTDRNSAIKVANDNGVYFAIAGSCQNPIDYAVVKDLPYYVGSIGTSIEEERVSARAMTEYYLQCMIHREKGDLLEWQCEQKGLDINDYLESEESSEAAE